jgi:cyclophilin family peptidyl-prolyl cis-trans isomerase
VRSHGNETRHILEHFRPGQLDVIGGRRIERLVTAIADDRARIVEETIGMFYALGRLGLADWHRCCIIMIGQTLDLIGAEHRIGLEKRNAALDLIAEKGPAGFTFADEIHPELAFDKPYLLAMANAGPGTNGSQFFITVADTPWLTGKHTIFGEVADQASRDVVDAIAAVPTGAMDKPVEPVVIESVEVSA